MKAHTSPMDGILDLFETFGTHVAAVVKRSMNDNDPLGPEYTTDMVSNMYYHYKTGVENRVIPWFDSYKFDWANSPQVDYVESMTNFGRETVESFFWNLDYLTKKGIIEAVYIQIDKPESSPSQKIADFGKKAGDLPGQVFKKMGWLIGGLAIVVIGGYSMPYIMKAMNKKKKR